MSGKGAPGEWQGKGAAAAFASRMHTQQAVGPSLNMSSSAGRHGPGAQAHAYMYHVHNLKVQKSSHASCALTEQDFSFSGGHRLYRHRVHNACMKAAAAEHYGLLCGQPNLCIILNKKQHKAAAGFYEVTIGESAQQQPTDA